jgi:transposase
VVVNCQSALGSPAAGKTAVIPPRANRSSLRDYDRQLYGARHLIENFFAKIKQFRAIATRYEKTARDFLPPFSWLPASFGLIDDRP